MKNRPACKRCVNGQLMRLGDEIACINCGWRPVQKMPNAYTAIIRRKLAA